LQTEPLSRDLVTGEKFLQPANRHVEMLAAGGRGKPPVCNFEPVKLDAIQGQ
jgi:hypothetical protein